MARHLVLSGLVVGLIAASSWTATAQQAGGASPCSGVMCGMLGSEIKYGPAPTATAPAAQPPVANAAGPSGAPAAPRSVSTCTGVMCGMLGSEIKYGPPPTAAAPSAAQPVADVADPTDAPAVARKTAVKSVPIVTIAADGVEAAHLKLLAAMLASPRVRIVRTEERHQADFSLVPRLDVGGAGGKAPLFTEQLHVVGGPAIHVFADLAGKVVSFGPDKSPTQAAARKAFAALGIKVEEAPLDFDNALDGVTTGDVAALVVLAPQPDARLAKLRPAAGLHLVSWPDKAAMPDGATAATITASAYPGLVKKGDTIRAVGVEAALDSSGKAATGSAAKLLLAALAHHSAALSKHGFDLVGVDFDSRNGRRIASVGH